MLVIHFHRVFHSLNQCGPTLCRRLPPLTHIRSICPLSFIARGIPTRGATSKAFLLSCVFAVLLTSGQGGLPTSGTTTAFAQDWPQIMGPERSGQATGQAELSTPWPKAANIAWQVDIGSGYAGPAVVGEQVLALHRLGQEEMLESFELSSGKSRWRAAWSASYRSSMDPDNGPRCVPTVVPATASSDSPVAICYGAAGDLTAVELNSGKLRWHRKLRSEYRADDGYFGAGSSPLVVGQRVIVCLGGKQAGIVAVDLDSGKTLWTATDYDASYTAPVAVDPQTALVVTRLKTVLIDLSSGSLLSEIPFGSRGPTVNAAVPIPIGSGRYLLTASYGVGMTIVSTANRQLDAIITGSELLSSQYNTPVLAANRIIGIDGREDVGVAALRCIDLDSREVLWTQAEYGTAHLIAIGSQVLTLTIPGRVALIDAAAGSYRELAHTQLPAGTYRALPALSSSKFIVRDSHSAGRSKLLCVELPH